MTPKFPLEIYQGEDFTNTFNWYVGGKAMAPIEGITIGYPTIIQVTAHGLPTNSKTPVIISGLESIFGLNSTDLGIEVAEYIDADTFSMPISSVGDTWEAGTGEVTWFQPGNITGFTAEMQLRKHHYSEEIIHTLTTENGGITLTEEDASIRLDIDKIDTAAFTFNKAVWDLNMIDPGGILVKAFRGTAQLIKQVTR